MRIDIKDQVAGNWSHVLSFIGIDDNLLNGKHHDCLMCGKPKHGRWVVNDNYYICVCGSHSAMDVAMNFLGRNFNETSDFIRRRIGTAHMTAPTIIDDSAKIKAKIDGIFSGLQRITANDPAGLYLTKRGVKKAPECGLAYHPGIAYWEQDEAGKWQDKGLYPALIGIIRKGAEVVGLQINYLDALGNKANITTQKKNIGEKAGHYINFNRNMGDALAISEGIVNGLLFMQDSSIPTIAAIDAGNFRKIVMPDNIKHVYIIEDFDMSFKGRMESATLAYRLYVNNKLDVTIVSIRIDNCGKMQVDYINPKFNIDYADYVNARE